MTESILRLYNVYQKSLCYKEYYMCFQGTIEKKDKAREIETR